MTDEGAAASDEGEVDVCWLFAATVPVEGPATSSPLLLSFVRYSSAPLSASFSLCADPS